MKRVLFICSRNRLRSPTAEQVFSDREGFEVASAGLNPEAETPVSVELLEWANVIFEFMDPALVRLLEAKVGPFFGRG